MTQRMFFKGLGASGIVGTLIISGIALKMLGISPEMATTAINAAIYIGILLGLLGVTGVFIRIFR